MRKTKLIYKTAIFAIALLLSLSGCQKKEIYSGDPPWLKGTNIETLQSDGRFTIYLQLMERAGTKDLISKGLYTLFVPTDETFKKYFADNGIVSVDSLSVDEARELFSRHYLVNPRNMYYLIYQWGYGEMDNENGEYASFWLRKEVTGITRFQDTVKYPVPAPSTLRVGNVITRVSYQKYIPLFSSVWFKDIGGDINDDYPFMYPKSNWKKKANWHNAMIIPKDGNIDGTDLWQLATATGSGFICYLDQVVDPLITLDEYLSKKPEYSLYYSMLQKFAQYSERVNPITLNKEYTKSYGTQIQNIAHDGKPQTPPSGFDGLFPRKEFFTVFAPTNQVLQKYLNDGIIASYGNLDSVPEITRIFIINAHISSSLNLLSKMTKNFVNDYGDRSVINKSDIIAESVHMCDNGVLYPITTVLQPSAFTTVPGPLFLKKEHTQFLSLLNSQAGVVNSLSNPELQVTLFAPTNSAMTAGNVKYDAVTNTLYVRQNSGSIWVAMGDIDRSTFLQDHMCDGVPNLTGEGFLKMRSGNYVYFKNGVVSAALNIANSQGLSTSTNLPCSNGRYYMLDIPILSNNRMGQYMVNNPDLSAFTKIMSSNSMLALKYSDPDTKFRSANVNFVKEDFWTAFIPDNDAMAAAIKDSSYKELWSKTDKQAFVYYHFVKGNVIFNDGKISGTFQTERGEPSADGSSVNYFTLKIANTPGNLVITDGSLNQDGTPHTVTVLPANANKLVRNGVVHRITSVLKYK